MDNRIQLQVNKTKYYAVTNVFSACTKTYTANGTDTSNMNIKHHTK